MTEIYSFHSEQGDEYKLQFTTERSGIIADDILDQLMHKASRSLKLAWLA